MAALTPKLSVHELRSSAACCSGSSRALPSSALVLGRARVQAAVVYAPPSTARVDLLRDAEERWQRAENSPLDGVAFTPLEFEEALERYDFSFEVGEKVCCFVPFPVPPILSSLWMFFSGFSLVCLFFVLRVAPEAAGCTLRVRLSLSNT